MYLFVSEHLYRIEDRTPILIRAAAEHGLIFSVLVAMIRHRSSTRYTVTGGGDVMRRATSC